MSLLTFSSHDCLRVLFVLFFFFFQAEDGIRDVAVTGVQTCALPIWVTPALCASRRSASPKSSPSFFMMKEKTSPPVPQAPKQCQLCRSGKTKKEGCFSLWNGQSAVRFRPTFFRVVYWLITPAISVFCLTSSIALIN